MKRYIILIAFIVLNIHLVAAFDMNIDTVAVIYDTCYTEQIVIHISNTEDEPLWIWLFDTEEIKDEQRAIRK
ncbi:MAG: hypothetical protein J5905_08060, partial [Prevotella sp.]|nr:hypothetical protein [Prevotella sp.]